MVFSPLREASVQPVLFVNGRIIDPANGIDQVGDIFVENGSVVEVGQGLAVDRPQLQRIDLQGKWLVPGLVDMHVHLREPGDEYKETVVSGTKAAAAGGFTAVAPMPNTKPVNDNQAVTALILAKAAEGYARVYPVGAISQGSSGDNLAEYGEMRDAGVVAVSDDGLPVLDGQLMRRALEYAGNYNLLVISHSEELSLSRHGVMNEGSVSTRMGLIGIPRAAEEIMVYRDIALARYTGCPVHIAHVSTRESVSLIRRAKEQGCRVTAETAPHYFTLTEEAIGSYDARAKMNPPLRTADDVAAIQEGLRDGTLDAIATDHAPHSELEKDVEFDLAANGIIGLETALPLSLALVRDGLLSPAKLIELLSVNPTRILGVAGGSLAAGEVADLTVIDPERSFRYDLAEVVSKSSNSPFLGWDLTGKAVLTMVGGKVTYTDI